MVAQTVKNLPAKQATQVSSSGRKNPLEKEMATHFIILAWRIPWTGEPGGLQSRGSQSRTQLSNFTFTFYRASLVAHEVKNPPAMQETWV